MPIYEFACDTCNHTFEELVRSANATADVKCPKCGGVHIHKTVSMFAAKVNGGGAAGLSAASCAPTGT